MTGPPEPPGKPSILLSDNSVRLLWTTPPYDGGSRVTGYIIEMKKDQDQWIVIKNECLRNTFLVNNMNQDSIYLFRISAINKYGISECSQPTEPIKLIVDNSSKQSNKSTDGKQ